MSHEGPHIGGEKARAVVARAFNVSPQQIRDITVFSDGEVSVEAEVNRGRIPALAGPFANPNLPKGFTVDGSGAIFDNGIGIDATGSLGALKSVSQKAVEEAQTAKEAVKHNKEQFYVKAAVTVLFGVAASIAATVGIGEVLDR